MMYDDAVLSELLDHVLNDDDDAFEDGYDAYNCNEEEDDNPFAIGTLDYDRWRDGWYAAKRDFINSMYNEP